MTMPRVDAASDRAGEPVVLDMTEVDSMAWLTAHSVEVLDLVRTHGALVLRSFDIADGAALRDVAMTMSLDLFEEKEAIASRNRYANGVYSPSAWPARQQMCMHQELSYRLQFPGLMAFACMEEATSGGAIATADGSEMLDCLPRDLVARVEKQGWILSRCYSDDIGQSIEQAFGTSDRAEVDAYCQENMIQCRWTDDGALHTRQRRPGVVYHQHTGRRSWFNQLSFLSEWTLVPEVRDFLIDEYGAQSLPFNTYFGDGEPLTPDTVATINEAYESITVSSPMRKGDLTLVDNVRSAHGRSSYEGERQVLVALCDPVKLSEVGPRR